MNATRTSTVIPVEQWRKQKQPAARASHTRGKMNKIEAEYAGMLQVRVAAGEVIMFLFERVTFILGDDCRYTPDFMVQLASREVEYHEVKGPHEREDATVKIRVAATEFPHVFRKAKRDKHGQWTIKEIKAR